MRGQVLLEFRELLSLACSHLLRELSKLGILKFGSFCHADGHLMVLRHLL